MRNPRAGGFTLIELVMVIVIIGVLSAIIVPNYLDYVGRSQASTTKANLQLLRSSVQNYRSDNGGAYPANLAALVGNYIPQIPEDGVLSMATEKIPPVDGSGGWTYDPASGIVKPNLNGADAYGELFSSY